tara:strand:- start:239 stop:1048 length:810 start_codon:yes stop_codon:yes gene_type:complete
MNMPIKNMNKGDLVGIILALIFILMFFFVSDKAYAADDWGKTGHRVIGQIAQDNLTTEALTAVTELLNGETLATVSTWADEIRSDSSYDSYKVWHYVNMPLDKKYEEVEHTQDNVVIGIQKCIAVLKDNSASREEKIFHLRFLVHLVGDVHQPLHVGRREDLGGNKIYVEFFRDGTNLHRVWDTDMIENFNMSYTEISDYLQSYKHQDFPQGDAICWANESQQIVKKVYEIEVGTQLSYSYIYNNFYIVKDRLYRAGIRLANLLNSIYV